SRGTDGAVRCAFARAELDERCLDASRPVVVAVADGFGLDWAEIGEPAEDAALSLRLVEDVPVEGRILNEDRKPVVGAKVFVRELTRDPAARDHRPQSSKTCRGPLPGHLPQVTITADGRFRLTGVG